MKHQFLPILPQLQKYVVQASHFEHGEEEWSEFKLVPRIYPTLFFVLKKRQSLSMSFGSEILSFDEQSIYAFGIGIVPAAFKVSSSLEVILVQFQPDVFSLFHREVASIGTNQRFDITDQDIEIRNLNEQLFECVSVDQKWQLIQFFLTQRLQSQMPSKYQIVSNALQLIKKHSGVLSMPTLVSGAYTSQRNLNYLFLDYVGVSPKKYLDIVRFNAFVNMYGDQQDNFTKIAYRCGYYDLSHLNKSFIKYMGASPSEYFGYLIDESNNWNQLDYLKP